MLIRHILASKGANVVSIDPDQTLREAVALLAKHRIGALVVANKAGKPVGIISERDIIRVASQDERFFDQRVAAVMTTNVIIGSPNDDILSVQKTMTEKRFRHLPIMEGDKLAGIISVGDIVKAMVEEYQGEVETLKTYIMRWKCGLALAQSELGDSVTALDSIQRATEIGETMTEGRVYSDGYPAAPFQETGFTHVLNN